MYRFCVGLTSALCHAQIPVAIPPNLDPAVAKQVIEYLKANPEAAQQSYEQAHRMLQTPGMAQTMLEAKVRYFKTYKLALEPPPDLRPVASQEAKVPAWTSAPLPCPAQPHPVLTSVN